MMGPYRLYYSIYYATAILFRYNIVYNGIDEAIKWRKHVCICMSCVHAKRNEKQLKYKWSKVYHIRAPILCIGKGKTQHSENI